MRTNVHAARKRGRGDLIGPRLNHPQHRGEALEMIAEM